MYHPFGFFFYIHIYEKLTRNITESSSELASNMRVYSLPNIEYDFWTKMVNTEYGFIRVISKAMIKVQANPANVNATMK